MLPALARIAVLLVVTAPLFSGCAYNKATATADPSADLGAIKVVHVVKTPDDDHDVNTLIAADLRSRGYSVTTSIDTDRQVDALVTYQDKWIWDITMYMLELTITVRDPKTDYPLASGNSMHTSLTRKSPTEMVAEVIDSILKQGK
jgi:hypothetical protein